MYLHRARLASTAADLRNGGLDLHTYIDTICDRIDAVEPYIAALLPEENRRERLHAEADALLTAYPNPLDRPRLYGTLVGVKDIFHVDGFVTRGGSQVPPEQFAGPEAVCVRQLRDAGALVVGKTVTTEFAFFQPGPTRNPHNPLHTPGGSSSGSAAAVAAGLCPLAIGTQTIGSVIRPAAFCGVVGFKPSYDRIATAGLLHFSRTADHVGLFTQEIKSMVLAASVLLDQWQPETTGRKAPLTIGVPIGPYLDQTEPEALAAFMAHLARLEAAGHTVKQLPLFADIEELNTRHRRLVAAEFAQEHRASYAQYADHYAPVTREIIEVGKTVSPAELAAAQANCLQLRADLQQVMESEGLDLWLCPAATGPAPLGIHATGNPLMNLPWTHAGLPAISLPMGTADNGLPLGLQWVARFGQDEQLLAWAQQLGVS